MLSLGPWRFASRLCVTLEGETDAATLACCVDSAACTEEGTVVPTGRARPSAHRTRMLRRPVREVGFPPGLLGVGVVDRGGSSGHPADKVAVEAFLVNLPNPFNMVPGQY
jgi:hypothetical protein